MSIYSQVEADMDKKVEDYIRAASDATRERLKRLCAQPRVSAYGHGIHECAQLVKEMLEELVAEVSLTPAPESGYPVIYCEIKGRSERTVLFYDHFDVQPPEPMELWTTPPFEPAQRLSGNDERIFVASWSGISARQAHEYFTAIWIGLTIKLAEGSRTRLASQFFCVVEGCCARER